MPQFQIDLNGAATSVVCSADTPLLWVLRDVLGMTGTKFGCGRMLCGACTVHVDGAPTRSCTLPIEQVAGRQVTTIEGLGDGHPNGRHPLQQAWIDEAVPQCGYCQSGQLMSAAALLAGNERPNEDEIRAALRGNLCRCGTYQRIVAAVKRASRS